MRYNKQITELSSIHLGAKIHEVVSHGELHQRGNVILMVDSLPSKDFLCEAGGETRQLFDLRARQADTAHSEDNYKEIPFGRPSAI